MIIRIIAVGRLRKRHWQEGVAEYACRLRPYARLEIIEVPESRVPDNARTADEAQAMAQEARMIKSRLERQGRRRDEALVIALDRQGRALDSREMADLIKLQMIEGRKELDWIIGGPLGLDPEILKSADMVISFSRLTFPHQMMRLILLEQIYRGFRIIQGRPYHK